MFFDVVIVNCMTAQDGGLKIQNGWFETSLRRHATSYLTHPKPNLLS